MYVPRLLSSTLRRALDQFPAVLITGPRQSGKTTFVQEELGGSHHYASLDDPLQSALAHADPVTFLDQAGDRPLVLDEIQHAPELLQHLKQRIDSDRQRTGRFVLTGSQQFALMAGVSESLAGRVAVLELLPFTELEPTARSSDLAARLYHGDYPEPALHPERLGLWRSSYLRTYVERDVRQLTNVRDLRTFELFVGLLAARHGQEFHQAALATEAGLTQPTVKSWLGILDASYLVTLVPPYSRNFGKRLIKRPKVFLLDSSLVCALTRQPDPASSLAGPLGGALLEGWVVAEARKVFAARGEKAPLHHWRTRPGHEVDLILDLGTRLLAIEVKLTATPRLQHAAALRKFRDLSAGQADVEAALICTIDTPGPLGHDITALPWHQFPRWLEAQLPD